MPDVPLGAGQEQPVDPTEVIPRRLVAWAIDLGLYVAVVWLVSLAARGAAEGAIVGGVAAAWFVLVYGLLQGLTGASPGKLATGIRAVDEWGERCGVRRSLVRSLLWFVDGMPYVFGPVVGIVGITSSRGHRRVGDVAAGTFVVGSASVGEPLLIPGLTDQPGG